MVLKEAGQTFQYGPNEFTIGDLAIAITKPNLKMCGFIEEIDTGHASCPTALCDFGDSGKSALSLRELTPLTIETPVETGRQYVLHCARDGEEGQNAHVIGISNSESVLLRLMLEDVRKGPKMEFHYSLIDEESAWICFSYESVDEEVFASYSIVSVPVYSKKNGGTAE